MLWCDVACRNLQARPPISRLHYEFRIRTSYCFPFPPIPVKSFLFPLISSPTPHFLSFPDISVPNPTRYNYTFSSAALLPSMATDGLLAEYCTAWPSSVTQRHLILTQLMTYIKSILKLDDQMAPATQRQLSTRPVATGRVALTDKTRTKTDEQNKFIKIIIVREISLL